MTSLSPNRLPNRELDAAIVLPALGRCIAERGARAATSNNTDVRAGNAALFQCVANSERAPARQTNLRRRCFLRVRMPGQTDTRRRTLPDHARQFVKTRGCILAKARG